MPAREDPRDALVVKAGRLPCMIAELPAGSVIGTSSIRRTAQLALKYPHLEVKDIRLTVLLMQLFLLLLASCEWI